MRCHWRNTEEQPGPTAVNSRLAAAMGRVERTVGAHYPEALDPLKAALAVAAVGCLTANTQPTTLIFVARSGGGKTLVLSLLMPDGDGDPLHDYVYRSDKVTTASFVSHRADRSEEELREIDLLPRIKGKTLVSKELAPFFAGKRDELIERFATLASVLDGMGFTGDSGAHGRRGYAEAINFQWLGATTPLSAEVLEVMAQLGPRLLFYDADRPRKGADELVDFVRRPHRQDAMRACAASVRHVLLLLYRVHPPATVATSTIVIREVDLRQLALWADVLTRLRAKIPKGGNEIEASAIEHAERVLGMLTNFAIASGLVHGRLAVNDYDLAQVAHIALSSGVANRGRVFRAVLETGGESTTSQVTRATGLSTPTALRYMTELKTVGLARVWQPTGTTRFMIKVMVPFAELCEAPVHKAKKGEGEEAPDPCRERGPRGA